MAKQYSRPIQTAPKKGQFVSKDVSDTKQNIYVLMFLAYILFF
jgi:hypothetical protein